MAQQLYPTIQPPPNLSRKRPESDRIVSTTAPPIPKRTTSLSSSQSAGTLQNLVPLEPVQKQNAGNQETPSSLFSTESNNSTPPSNFSNSFLQDLEGMSTTFLPRSSSLEDLSSSTKPSYPDYSHLFRELNTNSAGPCLQSFTPVQNLPSNSQPQCNIPSYGWNMNAIASDFSRNKYGSGTNFGNSSNGFETNFCTMSSMNGVNKGPNSGTNQLGIPPFSQNNSINKMGPATNPPPIGFVFPVTGAPGNPFMATNNPSKPLNPNPSVGFGFSDNWCPKPESSLPRPASWGDMTDSSSVNISNGFASWTKNALTDEFDINVTPPAPSSTGDTDLIQLSGVPVEHEYLSLDYFDPLYNRGRRESVSGGVKDSSFNYSFGEPFPSFEDSSNHSEGGAGDNLDGDQTFVKEAFVPSNMGVESAVSQSSTKEVPPRPPLPPKASAVEKLRKRLFIDEESDAFCQMVAELKGEYKSTDIETNKGYIVCPIMDTPLLSTSVKLMVYTNYNSEPYTFTCDTDIMVEHVISQVLCNNSPSRGDRELRADDFVLKVYDRALYLPSKVQLCCCGYVHQCLKLDKDIKFEMLHKELVTHPFLRTVDDDAQILYFPKEYIKTDEEAVSKEHLDILMETFYNEMEKLRDTVLKGRSEGINGSGITQSVKAICANLAKIETTEITKALERLERTIIDLNRPNDPMSQSTDRDTVDAIHVAIRCSYVEELEEQFELLVIAVKQLIKMYCNTFHTDFVMGTAVGVPQEHIEVTSVEDNFLVHVCTAHRLPSSWTSSVNPKYDEYKVIFSLFHGNKRLAPDVSTTAKPASHSALCDRILWDECLQLESTPICVLPKETRLCITLVGYKSTQTNNADGTNKITMTLGGATIQLFSQRSHLVQGSQLVPLQMGVKADHLMPSCRTLLPDSVLLQVNLPDFDKTIFFPTPIPKKTSDRRPFNALYPDIQNTLLNILEKESTSVYDADDMEILWQYRNYVHEHRNLLPRILTSAHGWDWACLSSIYRLLDDWDDIDPMVAFQLLLPQYPDVKVREFAVRCISKMNTDDLVDFLPQLIQALKFESYHNSPLARMLLEQSCKSIRFAHQFFWLLKGVAAQDAMFKRRYELMFVALASVAGDALYQEFRKQEELVKILASTAEHVRTARDKDVILRHDLQALYEKFEDKGRLLMPYNPSIEVCGIDIKSCSYFTSNAFPLKLVFKNSNSKADPVYAMYKVGDDLRQDMLTLQMINIMDQLWLKSGLDLKMIIFACLATGPKRGIIELITESDTLRKIQVSSGVTGSFKDRPIKEWLQRHNPTELEYRKAVENFTYSCAGYCVATYVLGIGDRHNDNIMLKESGHMFHIDFSKFLGDSQMFGSFKRDRVPFVLTSDMVYVINDGGQQTGQFQHFIDLCSQGFNILRKHHDLFYSLFLLMSRSGIPGVTETAAQYVKRALLPGHTDAEASAMFTRMIEESIKSVFTQFNFFIHNLAQLKFSSHTEGALLSFVPKTYSVQTDGKIESVKLEKIQKRYTPDKHYIYILRIDRKNQKVPSYIYRLFQEFVEFRDKLASTFSLIQWPNFSTRMVLGRSNVRTVAESRQMEIEQFLQNLMIKAPEISQCDLVYTFFHPLLRDEQEDSSKFNVSKLKEEVINQPVMNRSGIQGNIKISLHYKKDLFQVMIIHVNDLPCSGTDTPSPYVKTYLLPDPDKQTKQKTKIARNSANPTYNELLEYKMPLEHIRFRILQVTVWDHDVLKGNNFLGAVYIKLQHIDLSKENSKWYPLGKLQMSPNNMLS